MFILRITKFYRDSSTPASATSFSAMGNTRESRKSRKSRESRRSRRSRESRVLRQLVLKLYCVSVLLRQPGTDICSRTRSEATKSPFVKGGFRGNVNIFYSFRLSDFLGFGKPSLMVRGKVAIRCQACLKPKDNYLLS